MTNPNTKNPPVLTMPVTVRLDRSTFYKLVEQSCEENVTLSHLVRQLINARTTPEPHWIRNHGARR